MPLKDPADFEHGCTCGEDIIQQNDSAIPDGYVIFEPKGALHILLSSVEIEAELRRGIPSAAQSAKNGHPGLAGE